MNKRLENVLENIMGDTKATPMNPVQKMLGSEMSPLDTLLEPLMMGMQQLEKGLMQIANGQQAMGIALDSTRLTVFMLVNMLIEKGMFDKEEWDERYKKDVVERMQRLQQEIEEHMKKQMEAAQEAEDEPAAIMSYDDENVPEEENNSDIVLPSEKSKIIKFPAKNNEEK